MNDAPRSTKQLEHLIEDPELFDVGLEYGTIRDILLEVVSKVNSLSTKPVKSVTQEVSSASNEEVRQLSQQFNQLQESTKQQYSEFNTEIRELKAFFSFQLKDIREKYDNHITKLTKSISNPVSSRFTSEPQIEFIADDEKYHQLTKQVENLSDRFDNLMNAVNSSKTSRGSSRQQNRNSANEGVPPIKIDLSTKTSSLEANNPDMDIKSSTKNIGDLIDIGKEIPLKLAEKPTSQPVSPILKPIVEVAPKEIKKDPRVDDLVLQVKSIVAEMKTSSEKNKKMISTINNLIKEFERQSTEVAFIRNEVENKNDEFDRIYDKMAAISVDAQKAIQDKFDEISKLNKSLNSKNKNQKTPTTSNDNSLNKATISALESLKNSFISNFEKLDSNYRPQIGYIRQEISQLKNQIKILGGTIDEISAPKFSPSPLPQLDLQLPPVEEKHEEISTPVSDINSSHEDEVSTASAQTNEGYKDIPIRHFSTSTPNGSIPNTIDTFDLASLSPRKPGEKPEEERKEPQVTSSVSSESSHKTTKIPPDDILLGGVADSNQTPHFSSISTVRQVASPPPARKLEFSLEHMLSLSIVSNDIQQMINDAVREQLKNERLKELSKIETQKQPTNEIDVDSIMSQISELQKSSNVGESSSKDLENMGIIISKGIVDKFKPVIENHEQRIEALQQHIEILESNQNQSSKELQQIRDQQKKSSIVIKDHRPTIISPRVTSKKLNLNSQPKPTIKKEEKLAIEIPIKEEQATKPLKMISEDDDSEDNTNEISFTNSDFMEFRSKIFNLERAFESLSKKVAELTDSGHSRPQTSRTSRSESKKTKSKKLSESSTPTKVATSPEHEHQPELQLEPEPEPEPQPEPEKEENKEEEKGFHTISIPPVPKKLNMLDKINPHFHSLVQPKRIDEEIEVALGQLSRYNGNANAVSMPLFDVVEREQQMEQQEIEDKKLQEEEKELKSARSVRISLASPNNYSSKLLTASMANLTSSRASLNVNVMNDQVEKIVSDRLKEHKSYCEDQFRVLRKHIQNIISDLDLIKAPAQGMIILPNSDADVVIDNSKKNTSDTDESDENSIRGIRKILDVRTNDLQDQITELRRDIYQVLQKLTTMAFNNPETINPSPSQMNLDEDKNDKSKKDEQKKPPPKPVSIAQSESFLKLKKKFMEEINSPRMLKTTHYETLIAPELTNDSKKKAPIVEKRQTENNFSKVQENIYVNAKEEAVQSKSEKPKKISSSNSDPSILLRIDQNLTTTPNADGAIYEIKGRYGNELRRFWGRNVPQLVNEIGVTNVEPVKEVIETLVLPYIMEMRGEFQKKVDTALEKSRLAEELIMNKVDKEFVNDFFRKMRMKIVELKGQIDEVKNSVPDKVTHEELQSWATDLYKSVTKEQTTTVGTKSYRCLFCGAPKQNVSGMITDKSVAEALGDPQQARATQLPTMIFGSDKQCYKGKGNYGRTGIASKLEQRKIPPLREVSSAPHQNE